MINVHVYSVEYQIFSNKVLHVVYQHFSSIKCCLLFGIVHQESNVAFKRASFSQYFAGELQISLAGEFSSALLWCCHVHPLLDSSFGVHVTAFKIHFVYVELFLF